MSLLLYFETTSYYFASDTFDFLGPPNKANLKTALLKPELRYTYRPVPRIVWLLLFPVLGREPFWYHVMNIVTHAVCGFVLYLLALRLKNDRLWAILAGALFIAMPVHFDVVSTVFHWVEPLSTALLLASMLSYMNASSAERPRLPWLAAALFLIALLTKQSTVSMLLVLFFWEVLLNRGGRGLWQHLRSRFTLWLPFAGALVVAGALNMLLKPGDESVSMVLGISLSHRMPIFMLSALVKAANPWFLPGLAITVAAPLLLGGKLARFSLLATLLLPFPFYALAAERHLYLPSVGLALALAAFLRFGDEKSTPVKLTSAETGERLCADVRRLIRVPAILDLVLILTIVAFFLMPYRAPDPSMFDGDPAAGWHSQLDPAYYRSCMALVGRLTADGLSGISGISMKRAFLMMLSLLNLIAIPGLLFVRLANFYGRLNPVALRVVRYGLSGLILLVFAATTYRTVAADPRPDSWREDAVLIQMKQDYPELPDNTVVYVSPDSAVQHLRRLRFYYDLKELVARKYADLFNYSSFGDKPPNPTNTRCFAFEHGKMVRKERDEEILLARLKTQWRPEFAHFSLKLGRWPILPDLGGLQDAAGWVLSNQRVPAYLDQLSGDVRSPSAGLSPTLCCGELDVPTLCVELVAFAIALSPDGGEQKTCMVLCQLDAEHWFGREFEAPSDGVLRTFEFRLNDRREWFLADRVTGLCLVFPQDTQPQSLESVQLYSGGGMGLGLAQFPGGDEQLDVAIQDIFRID